VRPRAVGYVRQSRRKDSEASPESQRASIEAFCQSQGWDLVRFHEDIGVSGWDVSVQRPGLDAVLADVRAGRVDRVVVRDLSRLSRRGIREALEIVETLEEAGVKLVSVGEPFLSTDSPIAQAVFSLFAAFAKQESDLRSEKVKEAKASIRRNDPRFQGGRVPFGCRLEAGRLVVDEKEGPIVRAVAETIIGGASVASQVRWLNDNGHRGRNGAEWTITSLTRTLRSVYLAGWVPDGGPRDARRVVVSEDGLPVQVHEAVLDETTFLRLQERLRTWRGRAGRGEPSLLRGVAYCGLCGSRLYGDRSKDSGRGRYRCSRIGCDISVSMPSLDRLVASWTSAQLAAIDPDAEPEALAAIARIVADDEAVEDEGRRRAIRSEIEVVTKALENLDDDRADGLIAGDRYARQVSRLQERLGGLRQELEGLEPAPVDLSTVLDPVMAADDDEPGDLLLRSEHAPALIRAVMERVTVLPSGSRRGTFDPDRAVFTPRGR
jgi:DNA invertase Pin-like site-specific DNA recombinase